MSHVQLLLNMVSAHKDDLELWAVDEVKTGTVARITKLASDAYIQQHNKQQEAEKQKTTHAGAQAAPLLADPNSGDRNDLPMVEQDPTHLQLAPVD